LRASAGIRRREASANALTSHLSYWTDNGAAYWYRTEAGRTIGASVADAVEALVADGVPVRAVELDSWCYQHEVPRPITEIGYPDEVPPSGMMTWQPRPDAFDPETGERYDDVIMIWVGSEADKLALVEDVDSPFFSTPHFDGHPSVLIRTSRLGELSYTELAEIVQDAWLAQASDRRGRQWLASRGLA
jgi:hypothetical protein